MALSDESVHGGVTDEMMEQFFADHPTLRPLTPLSGQGVPPGDSDSDDVIPPPSESPTSPTPEPTPQPEPQPAETPSEGEPETVPEPATPEPSPESPEDFVELDGQRYARSQLNAAAQFQQHLAGDPQLQRLITDYLTGASIAQTPQTPQSRTIPSEPDTPAGPPADLDLDDPSVRALYALVQQQSDQLAQLQQGLRTTFDASMNQQRQQIDAQWRTASAAFGKDHDLEQTDVEKLGEIAARLG